MDIAQSKRKENIAEYILYLWQLEDLLRALQFSPEAIYSQLVAPRELPDDRKLVFLQWYMEIADLLRNPVGEHYRATFARLEPELPKLRAMLRNDEMSDTEIEFRALYAAMLYRIKGDAKRDSAIGDTIELVSPAIGELAAMYGKVERGEIDLFKDM